MAKEAKKLSLLKAEGLGLETQLALKIFDLMVQARALEERLIQMYKTGHGYFWIGGPGEEAFNVPLGLLIDKGQGPAHDFLHFHYRQSATLLAIEKDPVAALRQMKNAATMLLRGPKFCRAFFQAGVEPRSGGFSD